MSFEELSVEVVDSMSIPSMTRATSRIEWNISPDTVMKADTAYSLEADEIDHDAYYVDDPCFSCVCR